MSNTILAIILVVVLVAIVYGIWAFAKNYHARRALMQFDEMAIPPASDDAVEHTLTVEESAVPTPPSTVEVPSAVDKVPEAETATKKCSPKKTTKTTKTAKSEAKTESKSAAKPKEKKARGTGVKPEVAVSTEVKATKKKADKKQSSTLPSIDKELAKPVVKRGRKKTSK